MALNYLLKVDGKARMASWHHNGQHMHACNDPWFDEDDAECHRYIYDALSNSGVYRYTKVIYTDTPEAAAAAAAKLAQAIEEEEEEGRRRGRRS